MLTTLSLLLWIHSTFNLGLGYTIHSSSFSSKLNSGRSFNCITNQHRLQNQRQNTFYNDINNYFKCNHQHKLCLQSMKHKKVKTWKISRHYAVMDGYEGDNAVNEDTKSIRSILRKLTGFSLTAFRVSARATSASIRATLRATTGVSLTGVLNAIVGMFPLWVSRSTLL